MGAIMTDHAERRMSQRGVCKNAIEAVIRFGDRCVYVGNGCTSISVSWATATDLAKAGEINPAMVDRLTNLAVVVANDNEAVVTVVRPKSRKAARSYCKPKGYKAGGRDRRGR